VEASSVRTLALATLACSLFIGQIAVAQAPSRTLYGGEMANKYFGAAMDGGVDLNGDGKIDFVVGARARNSGIGAVEVFSSDGTLNYQINGGSSDVDYGGAVKVAGDLNGDGHPDFLVGSLGTHTCNSTSTPGHVRAYSGLDHSLLYAVTDNDGYAFGAWIAVLNDVTGDGVSDFAVSNIHAGRSVSDPCSSTGTGSVSVYSGATGNLYYAVAGSSHGDELGRGIGAIGDLNADGKLDWAAAPNGSSGASIKICSGSNGAVLTTLSFSSEVTNFARLGDVNGDSVPDFIVAQPFQTNPVNTFTAPSSGVVYVVSGANLQTLYTLHGEGEEHYFGQSLAVFTDVTGDTIPDFIVGAAWSGSYIVSSYARIISGFDGATVQTFYGDHAASDAFGSSVLALPDINGDGIPDFAVGSPRDTNDYSGEGSVKLFGGPYGALPPSNVYRVIDDDIIAVF
jgi:hypothetical protein